MHRPAELHGSHHCLSKYCSLALAVGREADVPTSNPKCKTLLALFRPGGEGTCDRAQKATAAGVFQRDRAVISAALHVISRVFFKVSDEQPGNFNVAK